MTNAMKLCMRLYPEIIYSERDTPYSYHWNIYYEGCKIGEFQSGKEISSKKVIELWLSDDGFYGGAFFCKQELNKKSEELLND